MFLEMACWLRLKGIGIIGTKTNIAHKSHTTHWQRGFNERTPPQLLNQKATNNDGYDHCIDCEHT